MNTTLFESNFCETILAIEVPQSYKYFDKVCYKTFNNGDTTNMYTSINCCKQQEAILLAAHLLRHGIWCRIQDNDVNLASYWGEGNILVMPILKDDKYYLYFIIMS